MDLIEQELMVRSRVLKYADGAITLDQFKEWFFPTTWESDSDLIGHVKHALAELDQEEDLKTLLRSYAEGYTTRVEIGDEYFSPVETGFDSALC